MPVIVTALRSTIGSVASAPPPVEDTLVSGYRRLASEAKHRRIDIELRVLDIFFVTLFGIVLLPIGLVIAAIVRVTSGSPVSGRKRRIMA